MTEYPKFTTIRGKFFKDYCTAIEKQKTSSRKNIRKQHCRRNIIYERDKSTKQGKPKKGILHHQEHGANERKNKKKNKIKIKNKKEIKIKLPKAKYQKDKTWFSILLSFPK